MRLYRLNAKEHNNRYVYCTESDFKTVSPISKGIF